MKIFVGLLLCAFTSLAQAEYCGYKEDKYYISKATHVFTAEVISNNEKIVKLKIIKSFKGNPAPEVEVSFKSEIAHAYRFLKPLKVGEKYLIAANSNILPNQVLDLGQCGLRRNVSDERSKETLAWLDK